jgi:Protein of unknown function (DUF3592)
MVSILVTFLLMLAAVSLAAIACYLIWQDWQFFGVKHIRTTGKIVGYQTRQSEDSTFYVARVQFIDDAGREREFVDTYGNTSPAKEAGGTLPVVYPKGAPQHARVKRPFVRLLIYAFVFGGPALVLAKYYGYLG